jgi:outer membrane protein TolC
MLRLRRTWFSGVLTVTLLVCLSWGLAGSDEPSVEPKQDRSAERTALLEERRDVLKQLVEIHRRHVQKGVADASILFRPKQRLLEAELELAPTAADRVRIYERLVEHLAAIEESLKKSMAVGMRTESEYLEAKAERLQAQADLLREQSGT